MLEKIQGEEIMIGIFNVNVARKKQIENGEQGCSYRVAAKDAVDAVRRLFRAYNFKADEIATSSQLDEWLDA